MYFDKLTPEQKEALKYQRADYARKSTGNYEPLLGGLTKEQKYKIELIIKTEQMKREQV